MSELAYLVRRFVGAARSHPSLAVTRETLDDLEREADRAYDGAFAALHAPIAPLTWMARMTLLHTERDSESDVITIGEPMDLVGLKPTVLLTDATRVQPPPEALDVQIEIGRKSPITARAEQQTSVLDSAYVVNLPHVDIEAPRLFGARLKAVDPVMTFKVRWAVPLTTVTAMNWGDVQVSFGMFLRPLTEDRR